MFMPFGELGLGELSEEQKESFLNDLGSELGHGERIEAVNSSNVVRKGVGWDTLSHAADAVEVIGFMYVVGKSSPKTLRNFFDFANQWTKKRKIKYDAKKIQEWVDFMEDNHEVK